jgi:hypothetical protein
LRSSREIPCASGVGAAITLRKRRVAEDELSAGLDCSAAATFYATVPHGMSIQARDGASHAALLATVAGAMAAWQVMAGTDKA